MIREGGWDGGMEGYAPWAPRAKPRRRMAYKVDS